jgi:hypothetical protein
MISPFHSTLTPVKYMYIYRMILRRKETETDRKEKERKGGKGG